MRKLLATLILLISMPSATQAVDDDHALSILGRFELICPVCQQVFTSLGCSQTNTRAGIDRDLFARALGPQPEFYRISTCPRCGYSGYGQDFEPGITLPPDFIAKVRKKPRLPLPEKFTPDSDPRELDASVRYALAIQCYQWRQKPDEALAWLYLRASWIAREEGSTLPRDPRLERVMKYIAQWQPLLAPDGNQLDVEMGLAARVSEALSAGEFNRFQKPYVELALALILRRHGENTQAAALLDPLLREAGFSEILLDAMKRMRASIDTEKNLQQQAAALLDRALTADQIGDANRPAALYLLGELHRRLSRPDRAIRWFDRALAEKTLTPALAAWARQQRAACLNQGKTVSP